MIKIDLEDLSPVKKSMAIEVEPEEIARETASVLRSYAEKARIPGFRPGKAPLSLIRARFAKQVDEDVRERVMARTYREAAEEKGLRPLGDPVLDEISEAVDGGPLRFKTTFEVLPSIELKRHRGVDVRRPSSKLADGDVERALEELRQSRVQLVTEEGRAAVTGDVIVTDVEGVPERGETFRRERMLIEVGVPDNLPAFNERLLGARAASDLEFSVDYPKDYRAEALAGQSVRYHLRVHEIKRRQLPELDDEFARDLGDFAGLEALRQRVRDDLLARRRHDAERAVRQSVLDKVLLENPMVLPEVLVDDEVRHRLEELVRRLMLQGLDPQQMELDWKELRRQQEEPARKAVHARLVLDAFAETEGLKVEPREVEASLRAEATALGETYEKLRSTLEARAGLEVLRRQILREKSLDLLTSVANIQNEE